MRDELLQIAIKGCFRTLVTFHGENRSETAGDQTLLEAISNETGTNWYIQGGIKRRLLAPSLGKTILYGQYQEWDDFQVGNNGAAFTTITGLPAGATEISDTDVQSWGIGLVQEIDAAAMQLWVSFQQFDADLSVIQSTGASAAIPLQAFNFIQVGGKIQF